MKLSRLPQSFRLLQTPLRVPVFITGIFLAGAPTPTSAAASAAAPNIVLVMTDDQGYGDLGCTGNPIIKTPHIDRLAAESSSLTDYHVAPNCSPTRAALLTGHWTDRTDVTFTTALTAGSHQLAPVFTLADGGELGAYYAVVSFVR